MGNRAINAILGETWAMRPEALETMLAIAGREHEFADGDLQALEQRLGRPLMNTERATVREGVAIVPVTGPLFRYANIMTELSGATAYGTLATDLRAAVDDPSVSAIVLNIDSPGGAVKGAGELAKQIKEAGKVKPVVAYIGGDGASAAYWLASAASEIVADDSAVIGSIGAMIGLQMQEDKPGARRYTFTSSQSPLKNADPGTAEGGREIQRLVNEMGQVFVEAVAANRDITADKVLDDYGQGAIFTGTEALKRGMIDSIGTLEAVIARLSTGSTSAVIGGNRLGVANMAIDKQVGADAALPEITAAWVAENHPAVAEALRSEGAAAVDTAVIISEARAAGAADERARIEGIEALAMPGTEALIAELKADAAMTPDAAAVRILKAVREGGLVGGAAGHLAGLRSTEAALVPPVAGSGSDVEPTLEESAKAITELARKAGIDA